MMIRLTLDIALPDDLRQDELEVLQVQAKNALQQNAWLRAGPQGSLRLVTPRVITTSVTREA